MPGSPYIVAGGAILATWAIDHWDELFPSSPTVPRLPAMSTALERFVTLDLPCRAPRLASVSSITGAPIMRLPSGAGADFVREYLVQRGSLVSALGSFVPGLEWPRMSAQCAREWLERWLDAWQVANTSNPQAFRIEQRATSAPDTSSTWSFITSSIGQIVTPWVDRGPLPGHDTYERIGPWRTATAPTQLSGLGRAWQKLRSLWVEASAVGGVAAVVDIFGGWLGSDDDVGQRPWVGARRVTQAIYDFAGQLDAVGFAHPDARSAAVAQLKRDLHPVKFAEKAVDVVVTPIEAAAQHVVGPVLSATLGALASSLLPWLVVGGAVYYLARRAG